MKNKSILMTALLVGSVLAVCPFASQAVTQRPGQEQLSGFAYAQLSIRGDRQVTWDEGGPDLPRVRTIEATYRALGGTQRATLVNLLNIIGQQEWELIEITQTTWTFKRSN